MESLFFAFILFAILLLILAGTVTVRLVYRDELIVIIDFLFLQMLLFPSGKRVKAKKTAKTVKDRYKNALAIKRALDFLFKHSDIRIRALKIRAEEKNPAKLTVYNGYIDSLICILITYLHVKSPNLKNSDPPFSTTSPQDSENSTIDITLYTSFHVIAFTFITYYKDKRRKKART